MRSTRLVLAGGMAAGVALWMCSCGGDDTNQGSPDASTDTRTGGDSGRPGDGAPGDGTTGGDTGRPNDSGRTDGPAPGDSGGGDTSTTGDSGSEGGPPPTSADVVQHHKNPSRDGVYVDSAFTAAVAAGIHADATFAGAVTGPVYAQPLWVQNGPNGNEAFLVATEQNHVTAIDATGNMIWDQTFGTPVTGGLPCGNINPLGITGTPYVDTSSRTIYFDTMTQTGGGPRHMVYAISLDDGSTKAGWPVDVNASITGFDSSHQNERGALQLVGGILYVPYGGLDGDCDPYHGWVVGIPVGNPGAPQSWATTAARGGIWAAGSLPSDGTFVYAVTGNTEGTSMWGGGEAVVRLSAGPAFSGSSADYYAPSNWVNLDNTDLDLGGANDFLFDMPGAPVPHLVAAPGKDQNLYLLDRDNLGGIGGELAKTHVADNEMNAAGAAYQTSQGTYVAVRVANGGHGLSCPVGGGGNLAVVKVTAGNPPTAAVAWCSDEAGLGSPMVTSTDGSSNAIVWDANDHLYGYDGDTGAKVFAGGSAGDVMGQSLQYMNTFIETNGRIAVAVQGRLYLFH